MYRVQKARWKYRPTIRRATPDVHLAGDLAFVADGTSGLRIIDVSNPSEANEIGHYLPDDADVRGVDVVGSFAYLASGKPGLVVVEISDPRNPREVATIDTPRTARSVRLDGSYAYVGDLKWLRVIDISTPSAPREIASYKTPSYVEGIWVKDGTAFVADYDAGLMIVGLKPYETHLSAHHLDEGAQLSRQQAD